MMSVQGLENCTEHTFPHKEDQHEPCMVTIMCTVSRLCASVAITGTDQHTDALHEKKVI